MLRQPHSRYVLALASLALAIGCHRAPESAAPPPADLEQQVRSQLGIPANAKQVIVFGQNAHMDIDWQWTFDQYYQMWVHDILTQARQVMDQQPRAFYSVAEMGFLQHHLQQHPEEVAPMAAHAAAGALHIVGGGMTSPDTLLPEPELLFRDYLYGINFSVETLGVRPTAAWLPDSFGHSATAPDILSAAGFQSVAFSRIDGSDTILQFIQNPPNGPPPVPGSTAAMLRSLGSGDFLWQGPGGGSVMAHWLSSGLYCQGDNIDYQGDFIQVPGGHVGTLDTDPSFTDQQIDTYISNLLPVSPSPYLFVPVGCDFQYPKANLISYLDGYNQRQFPISGVWAVAAPFDTYAQLVLQHRSSLPSVQADLTPYFMGFYGSRPGVKRLARDAARPFFEAETFAVALGEEGAKRMSRAAPSLSHLTFADHHDFITGTANDAVVATDQLPLLHEALAAGESTLTGVLREIASGVPPAPGALGHAVIFNPASTPVDAVVELELPAEIGGRVHASEGGLPLPLDPIDLSQAQPRVQAEVRSIPPMGWTSIDLWPGMETPPAEVSLQLLDGSGRPATGGAIERVILSNASVRAQWDRAGAYALTSLKMGGVESLSGPSFTPTTYDDQGGLWRMGNEMPGCSMVPQPVSQVEAETVEVLQETSLSARVAFVSPAGERDARLDATDTGLRVGMTARADGGTTETISFHWAIAQGDPLLTSSPAGFVERAPQRVFTPTYWPAVEWASSGPWAVLLRQSTGVRLDAQGGMELITARNAQKEQCDIEGGTGTDPDAHRFDWVLTRVGSPAEAEQASQRFNRPPRSAAVSRPSAAVAFPPMLSQASVEGPGIISALKPAEWGQGDILRVLLWGGPVTVNLGPTLAGRAMVRTDAVERDLSPMGAAGSALVLDPAVFGSIASVRFLP